MTDGNINIWSYGSGLVHTHSLNRSISIADTQTNTHLPFYVYTCAHPKQEKITLNRKINPI